MRSLLEIKGLQYLECLTLYKLSPKVGRLLALEILEKIR